MRLSRKIGLSLAVATALMPSLSVAETLGDAIAAAYSGNPELQGNRDLVAASDEQVAQARAAYGPSLALSASHEFTSARIRGTLFPSSDAGFASSVELSLNQPLFTSGRISAGIDAAQAASLSLREGLRAQGQQLLLDVVNAYVSLQRDITLQAIAVENYDILRQQNQVTAARFALRDLTEPDLEQTSNRLELAAGRVLEARSAVEISAARYRHLVGHFPDDLAPLPGLPELPTLETLYVAAERFNPQLAKAHLVEEASRANVRAARAEMRPQVSAFSTLGRTPLSDYQNTVREEAVSAGIRVSLQLYSGGLQTSALREAIARNLADQQFTEETRRAMRESLAANWSFLRTAQATLPRYRAAVEAAKKAVDGVKKQETSGYRTLRDVLDVTNDLLNARIAAARAEADIYMRHVAILRDIGTLSIETLADLPPYDPDSRRSGVARYAGLPMRLVLGPLDRTFLPPAGDGARIDVEQSALFEWDGQQVDLLQPVLPGSPTTSPVVAP